MSSVLLKETTNENIEKRRGKDMGADIKPWKN